MDADMEYDNAARHVSHMAPSESKSMQCSHCSKSFGRLEHLKRHQLIHTRERQFSCTFCSKVFIRRDALSRHELTHQTTSPSLLSQGVRACIACATAKARCTGEIRCSRCQQRGLDCAYPDAPDQNARTPTVSQPSAMQPESFPVNMQQSLPSQLPLSYDTGAFDADLWDPNILSTTNWLDAVVDGEFPPLPLEFDLYNDAMPINDGSSQAWNTGLSRPDQLETSIRSVPGHAGSPLAMASTTSAFSGVSTESAADVCAAQEDSPSRSGEFYVDGEPARLPRTKRRKLSSKQTTTTNPVPSGPRSSFSLESPASSESDLKHRVAIPAATYETIFKSWQDFCLNNSTPWPAFEGTHFPPKGVFENLLGLYFSSFHRTLPFLHPVTFNPQEASWILILAMTAIGAHYLGDDQGPGFATSLHELLRRCLFYVKENPAWVPLQDLTVSQVHILQIIGLLYSGDERLTTQGLEMQQTLASSHAKVVMAHKDVPVRQDGTADEQWMHWIRREEITRTAHSLWLLDSQIVYHFQRRPLLSLEDCKLGLPCHEKLWTSGTAADWHDLLSNHAPTPSLQEALQEIYIDKRLPRNRGEFARVIMIHGLFHRSWDVERYISNPLSEWEPTAKKQKSAEILPSTPIWPPAIPTFTKWQNSVCDCLDILHWQANATIGQASGLEHPTVAFLHLARVVLLSPINSIVELAKAMVNGRPQDVSGRKRIIQRWAVQGQYKARLASIHAGVVFWHIRRYSIDGFYEAPAVALAALMLWAFGTFSAKQSVVRPAANRETEAGREKSGSSQDEGSDDSSSSCGIILLDRPTDDELVQQFIRRGHSMRAHITGVGDLYSSRGPERVLVEGCKLLGTLKCWGVNTTWLELLQKLIETCRK